jgi:hypothetical protein
MNRRVLPGRAPPRGVNGAGRQIFCFGEVGVSVFESGGVADRTELCWHRLRASGNGRATGEGGPNRG